LGDNLIAIIISLRSGKLRKLDSCQKPDIAVLVLASRAGQYTLGLPLAGALPRSPLIAPAKQVRLRGYRRLTGS